MKKMMAFICLLFATVLSINAYADEYNDGIISLLYDSSVFSVETTDGGVMAVKAINMPDDNGGHNTVLGCLSEKNTEYESLGLLTENDLKDFQNAFTHDVCTGLFKIDNGVSVIVDGYTYIEDRCEYFMILSDGTECYMTMYNYGETIYYSVCRLCPYTSDFNDEYRSIYRSIKLVDANEDIEFIEEKTEEIFGLDSQLETELNATVDNEYAEMLIKYGDIFADELSVFSNQKIQQLINDNASVSELMTEIASSLSEVGTAEENLQNYYNQFDSNRKEIPMGTPIMTLLSYAQSSLRQYAIALQHLQDYFSNPKQDYIDDFVEYTAKATDSLNKFNTLLISEKAALGLE